MNWLTDVEALRTNVVAFVQANQAWAPFVVGGLAFGESLAFFSVLFPATVLLVAIGALIGTSGLDFGPVWLGAVIGASAGDWLSYEIGRWFEDRAHGIWPLSRHPELIVKGEAFIGRYGVWAIFIGRFFGPLRAVVPLVAGIFEMPRGPFQLANVGSALIWALLLLKFGDVVGEGFSRLLRFMQV